MAATVIAFTSVASAFAFPAATVAVFVTVLVFALMMMAAFAFMMFMMMIASGIRVIFQSSFRKSLCRCVSRSLNTGIEPDFCISQRCLGAYSDPAANQGIGFDCLQQTRKRAMTVSI